MEKCWHRYAHAAHLNRHPHPRRTPQRTQRTQTPIHRWTHHCLHAAVKQQGPLELVGGHTYDIRSLFALVGCCRQHPHNHTIPGFRTPLYHPQTTHTVCSTCNGTPMPHHNAQCPLYFTSGDYKCTALPPTSAADRSSGPGMCRRQYNRHTTYIPTTSNNTPEQHLHNPQSTQRLVKACQGCPTIAAVQQM